MSSAFYLNKVKNNTLAFNNAIDVLWIQLFKDGSTWMFFVLGKISRAIKNSLKELLNLAVDFNSAWLLMLVEPFFIASAT